MNSLDKFLPSTIDKNIINSMYELETKIEHLTLDDFLKLPVNDQYKETALQESEKRFRTQDNKPKTEPKKLKSTLKISTAHVI